MILQEIQMHACIDNGEATNIVVLTADLHDHAAKFIWMEGKLKLELSKLTNQITSTSSCIWNPSLLDFVWTFLSIYSTGVYQST